MGPAELSALSIRQLADLGCALNGGTLGKDPARIVKADLVRHVASLGSPDVITSVWANMGGLVAAADPAPLTPPLPSPVMLKEVPVPVSPSLNGHAASALEAAIRDIASGAVGVDESAVRAIVGAELDAFETRMLEAVQGRSVPMPLDLSGIGGCPSVSIDGKHPIFPLVLALAALPHDLRPNILLVGPAGSGKSTIAEHVAEALGCGRDAFAAISLSGGVTEATLTARCLPIHEGGRFGSLDSQFVRLYQMERSVIFLDELDASDPNVLVVANAASGNGGFNCELRAVDGRPTWIPRGVNNVILAAANTFGTGATALYVGRGALDASTLDRYLPIEVDYDPSIEAAIMGVGGVVARPWMPSASVAPEAVSDDLVALYVWYKDVQAKAEAAHMRRVVSPRMLQKAKALRIVGCSVAETKARLLAGWTDDEKATIGFVEEPWVEGVVTASSLETAFDGSTYSANAHDPDVTCPKCGRGMILRTAHKGQNAGSQFYGCSQYPECRGTRPAAHQETN